MAEIQRPSLLFTFGIPVMIITSYLFLALQHDLRMSVPALIGSTAIVIFSLTIVIYAGKRHSITWSPLLIISIAVLIRIPFLLRTPELSDDIYRYVWDGLQMLKGYNPYSLAPADTQLSGESSVLLLRHVNHPELVTIYPPVAQLVFALGSFLSGSVIGMKTVLVVMDIAACILILRVLSVMHLPAWRAVLYAWHPLPVIEIAASGHIDSAGLLFLLICLMAVVSGTKSSKPTLQAKATLLSPFKKNILFLSAGMVLGCAVFVKLFPIIFLPAFIIFIPEQRKLIFLAGFLSAILGLMLPFVPDIFNMLVTLSVYLQNWEFSGFLFRSLREVTTSGNSARLVLNAVFLSAVSFFSVSLFYREKKYERMVRTGQSPQGSNPGQSGMSDNLSASFIKTIYGIALLYLLLTPTLHPWYALYLVCLFPFFAEPGGLILSWSVFLSYYVLINYTLLGQWIENDAVPTGIWLASVAGSLLPLFIRKVMPARHQ
jgi:hypothetical protein